jgi:hypothetical protein
VSTDFTYIVNGIDLDTTLGSPFLTIETSWRTPVTARRNPLVVPGRHGNIARQTLREFDESQFSIAVRVTGAASQSALESMVAKLMLLVTQPNTVVTRISGNLTTSASAEFVSSNDKDFLVGRTDTLIMLMAIPGVFWRQPASVGTALAFSANLTGALLPHLQGSSAPITDAVVRLKGPHTGAVSITDAATGTGLSQAATALTGSQYLYLDAARLRSWVSASDVQWTPAGTDVSQHLDYPGAGPLQLWPVVEPAVGDASFAAASEPRVRISATGGSGRTGDTSLAVYAGRSFL